MNNFVAVDTFLSWSRMPNPRFIRSPSNRTSWHANLPPLIPLRHVLGPRPQSTEITRLKSALRGASPALEAFYSLHDGAQLFSCDDSENEDAGFHLCPLSEMDAERDNVEEWFEDAGDDCKPGVDEAGRPEFYALPHWYKSTLVFGRFGYAAERLLLACSGPYEGRIFLFDHDPLRLVLYADSFEQLLERITKDPIAFFRGFEGNSFANISGYLTGKLDSRLRGNDKQ